MAEGYVGAAYYEGYCLISKLQSQAILLWLDSNPSRGHRNVMFAYLAHWRACTPPYKEIANAAGVTIPQAKKLLSEATEAVKIHLMAAEDYAVRFRTTKKQRDVQMPRDVCLWLSRHGSRVQCAVAIIGSMQARKKHHYGFNLNSPRIGNRLALSHQAVGKAIRGLTAARVLIEMPTDKYDIHKRGKLYTWASNCHLQQLRERHEGTKKAPELAKVLTLTVPRPEQAMIKVAQ